MKFTEENTGGNKFIQLLQQIKQEIRFQAEACLYLHSHKFYRVDRRKIFMESVIASAHTKISH